MLKMQAVLVKAPGGPDQLYIGETLCPTPGAGELLVKVAATALNRADIMQRQGKYPPPPGASDILGLEIAGTVVQTGPGVSHWKEGDRVFGLVPGGGYAEYALLHQYLALLTPPYFSDEMAAAIPEVFLTAYQALHWLGQLQEEEKVLIHAGASGVGTAAIQLARLQKAQIWVTATAHKHTICQDLGAYRCIDYQAEDFAEVIQHDTQAEGVHLVIDFLAAPYLARNIASLGLDGRLIMLSTLGGSEVERLNLIPFFRKRLQIKASTLRNRPRPYQHQLSEEFWQNNALYFAQGHLRPVIDRVFKVVEIAEAHRYLEANKNIGKVVINTQEWAF